MLRMLERLLAAVALVLVGGMLLLDQTTGAVTPCRAVAHKALPAIPKVATEVLEACVGAKGEGGLAGLVVDFGLALTGSSRDKLHKRLVEKLETELRADLMETGELRCTVLLVEGVLGTANGGPNGVATRMGEEHRFACRGDDKPPHGK